MTKRLIEVTAADIAAGMPGEAALCPVALAATRALNQPVTVCRSYMTIYYPPDFVELLLLPEVSHRTRRFDVTSEMEPFSFELEVPER